MNERERIKLLLNGSGMTLFELATEANQNGFPTVDKARLSKVLNDRLPMIEGFSDWAIPFLRSKSIESAEESLAAAKAA